MYSILALTAPDTSPLTSDERLTDALARLTRLVDALGLISPNFHDLGVIAEDTQAWIDIRVADYAEDDDGIPEDVIAEFDRLAASNRVTLLKDPEHFAHITRQKNAEMRALDFAGVTIDAKTSGLRTDGAVSRTLHDGPDLRGALSLKLPMRDKDDLWFADAAMMAHVCTTIVDHIPRVVWLSAYPSMYLARQKNLFRDRYCFGWMGFIPELIEDPGPLWRVTPLPQGNLIHLKPDMMTLADDDIMLCHKAEAFLNDQGVLPLR